MQTDEKILKSEERVAWALRSLYSRFGYTQYKMSKFEEYALYVRNKDFLVSDGIISFTDTSGKLLALKPDVTLSIIKNSKDEEKSTQKLYYDENVYRISKSSHAYKEIRQTGLECIGNIGIYETCEVVSLAIESLRAVSENYVLELSHAGLFEAVLDEKGLSGEYKKRAVEAISSKNEGELVHVLKDAGVYSDGADDLSVFTRNFISIEDALSAIKSVCKSEESKRLYNEFREIIEVLAENRSLDCVVIDFSLTNDMSYYSGIIFRGYVDSVPTKVISGGRYDKLMKKMKRSSGAIGFAVYLDSLERLDSSVRKYDVDCLVIYEKDVAAALRVAKKLAESGKSVRVEKEIPEKLRYETVIYAESEGDA